MTDFTLVYYSGDRKTGSLALVRRSDGKTSVKALETAPETGLDKELKPVMIGMTGDERVILLDPKTKQLTFDKSFPTDAFPAHIYSDPGSTRDWFMNDGDKESGNDRLNCGDQGSSVTVVDNVDSANASYLATICVGRGHHQAAFSTPSTNVPDAPRQAYISNLKDGTISVVGNDPTIADSYLKVIATIDLCEPEKEKNPGENNSFPHGLVYSGLTGKIYNLNNGYGTIAVINPDSHEIEERIELKGYSNLFISPDGRYIIGRGADRKSDPNHVIAKLAVIDLTTNRIVKSRDLPDIYISKYYFNPEGTRLYLTTGSKGSPEQVANLKDDVLLVFDVTALPEIKLISELSIGDSGSLSFLFNDGKTELVFSSDSAGGSVIAIDSDGSKIIESINVGEPMSHSRAWLI